MNTIELKAKLDSIGIRPEYYSLNGETIPGRIVLYQNHLKWEVFYFNERGGRDNEKQFDNENDACVYIYEYLRRDKEAIEQQGLKY